MTTSPVAAKIIVGGPRHVHVMGGHTQQPLITFGDITIVEHFVK